MTLLNTILIFCLVSCIGIAELNAQNVTIPDSIFKDYLVGTVGINTNGDGEIQVVEAVNFSGSIYCPSKNIVDLTGIEAFVNLRSLWCNNNELSSLDLTQNTNLILLSCYKNQLSSLDVTQCTILDRLACDYNQLSSLDVTQNVSLTNLACGYNQLNSLDVTQNTNLTNLNCYFNQLGSLDVTQNTSLAHLACYSNPLSNLDVTQNINLRSIDCYSNSLNSLDVTQNTNLEHLYCDANQLSSLDVTLNVSLIELHCYANKLSRLDMTQNVNLTHLYCYSNQLSSLDMTQNTNLIELYCYSNLLSSLDMSQNTILRDLRCENNQLTSLNLKSGNNGHLFSLRFSARYNPNLTCIQVDDSIYSANNWLRIDTTTTFSTSCSWDIVNHLNKDVNLTAYPNPSTKNITLDFGKTYQEVNVKVINSIGQIILNRNLQNSSRTILKLKGAAGVYFVNLQTEEGTEILKIIKE
jgi:hypothetical protein